MDTSNSSKPSSLGASADTPKPWEHAKPGKGSGSDPLAVLFVESLSYDKRLYKHDIAGSVAHARMLSAVGLITEAELQTIEGGLGEIEAEIDAQGDAWAGWKAELEDVHMCIEAALIEKTGDPGRKLHTGRSRNDQVATDLKLWLKEACQTLHSRFDGLFRAFIALAKRDGLIVMPSFTHMQRAQPIVVGGELVAWLTAFDRCWNRFEALQKVNEGSPLGSGAIAGTGLPIDSMHTAEALGLGAPTPSSIDATSSRDAAIDFVYALAMTGMTLSRWAAQWISYATAEFGFIQLDGRYTTGSSMMPQKCNPDMLELVRGRCGGVYGDLMALLTICKGIGLGYYRDLQEDKRHVFSAFDSILRCLEITTKVVETTRFNEGTIKQGLDRGFLDATGLAEYLVTRGVPFRTAHQIVGRLVGRCQEEGLLKLSSMTLDDFNQACADTTGELETCGPDVYQWLGAEQVVQRYRSHGNAGTTGFEQQLSAWQSRLAR